CGKRPKTYRDLYPDEEKMRLMPPPDKSVIGVTPAIVGSVEASEALKLICGYGEPLTGRLWSIDLRTMQSYILSL
ncbi:ThiF family adenylyltransferase, partial [Bacteroides heparinolyticus]